MRDEEGQIGRLRGVQGSGKRPLMLLDLIVGEAWSGLGWDECPNDIGWDG